MTEPVRCLEFFSGIGGLHYGLNIAGINAQVVASFDVNEIANKVYTHNFKKEPSKKTIDRLTKKDIERYQADCWLLSPPCQPYTQGGKMKDIDDPRAKPLLHLIRLLPTLDKRPTYLFLENVKNFEISQSRRQLIDQLVSLDYEINECLLSPIQFGIPNHRLRYYLTARYQSKKDNQNDDINSLQKNYDRPIHTTWPFDKKEQSFDIPELECFLEQHVDDSFTVPSRYILRLNKFRLDIVLPSSTKTSCVTKAYGSHHIMTSGSLLQTKKLETTEYNWEDTASLLEFGLRFLTPTEIARLHAFPMAQQYSSKLIQRENDSTCSNPRPFFSPCGSPCLTFPDDITNQQRYRLLGNSLNCWVVAELLRCVLFS
ncbi:S-adenosyl-L-methionine-dependent methyltransferase [Halteromyces radiatus]|uniref:S-adenosyl-L-methionine-dependent methyltransferase n=1 Tax=Halteromyces radiatus TaxID=101107 RepID=UPI00222090B0|nr:S-adenosyl-L-methionine-dependent methyltransferase [Halteromyces radiatus]KAI8093147.1 S-adenosyl-L-methionine-dependent methyltransferase [Halteromyces radiatus]